MTVRNIYTQLTIRETDPQVYDSLMNDALSNGRTVSEIIDLSNERFFCSIIRYTETEKVAETAREQAILTGNTHKCYECIYFVPSKDGRTEWTPCEHKTIKTRPQNECCDRFYEWLMQGKAVLK